MNEKQNLSPAELEAHRVGIRNQIDRIPSDLFTKKFDDRLEALHFLNSKIAQEINNSGIFMFHNKMIFTKSVMTDMTCNCVYKRIREDGHVTWVNVFKEWWTWEHRRKVEAYVFNNGEQYVDGYANLFAGFAVKPIRNDAAVEHTFSTFKKIFFDNDEKRMEAFVRIQAWQIQNIGIPSRIITLVKSDNQQTGKGSYFDNFMGQKIYGRTAFVTNDINKITGQFNSHMKGRTYIVLDEAGFSGDKRSANIMKNLSTTTSMPFESKGLNIGLPSPVAFNIVALTNLDTGAHIEQGDSRFFFIDMADRVQQNPPEIIEWNKLANETNDGIYAGAWLYYLQNLVLPVNYKPVNDLVFSDGKNDMILKGEPHSFSSFMDEIENVIPYKVTYSQGDKKYINLHSLIDYYKDWLGKYNKFGDSKTKIGQWLSKKGFGEGKTIKISGVARSCREIPESFQVEPDPTEPTQIYSPELNVFVEK